MAIFQVATNTPSKVELIAAWLADQSWAPDGGDAIELEGSFHLDDPDGEVGMQVHVVRAGDHCFQVPLTYRNDRRPDLEGSYLGPMEHSVLGTRHVYDGLGDDRFLTVFAGVAACGFGQALGFAHVDGRWQAWPDEVRIESLGGISGSVLVDDFEPMPSDPSEVIVRNDDLQLTVYRSLTDRPRPDIGVAATWPAQPEPVVLAAVELRS